MGFTSSAKAIELQVLPKQRGPYLATDVIVYKDEQVVLVTRKYPEPNVLALPGGFVEWGETVENAAVREVKEETGLDVRLDEILGVYSDPKRDVRGHVATLVFIATPISGELKVSEEDFDVKWYKLSELNLNSLAIDHGKILRDFLKWRKQKGTYWSSK